MKTDQLTLALEPEAASIYCQFCHPRKEEDEDTSYHYDAFRQLVKEKRKYMVIDLGGRSSNYSFTCFFLLINRCVNYAFAIID